MKNKLVRTAKEYENYFNPSTYTVIDKITGEELPVSIFIEKASTSGWQKAYAKTISEYIKCGDGKSVDLLAYILKNKTSENMLLGTQRELAKNLNISVGVVTKTINALRKKGMLKMVRQGCYFVNPDIMRNGNNKVGSMMIRLWGELKDEG